MKTKLAITAAMFAAATGVATADTIDAQYLGTGRGQNVKVTSALFNGNVFAGQLRHNLTNGTGNATSLNGEWRTYCTDLAQRVSGSGTQYTVVSISMVPESSPMGALKAQAIANMYAFSAGTESSSSSSNDFATAFQLAVWEIVTDYNPLSLNNGISITAGNFRATKTDNSPLSSSVNSHLSNLFGAITSSVGNVASLSGIASGRAQDQIIPTPIPAPATLALASAGLLCLAGRRRNK